MVTPLDCWGNRNRQPRLADAAHAGKGDEPGPPEPRNHLGDLVLPSHQVRQGVPLSEVQQQLGHARIDSTSVYAKLANPERRAIADRVEW